LSYYIGEDFAMDDSLSSLDGLHFVTEQISV